MFQESRKVFGKAPSDKYPGFEKSAHYRNRSFQNIHATPQLAEGVGYGRVLRHMLKKNRKAAPAAPIPVVKRHIEERQSAFTLTWFGHSSYLIQVQNMNILVDPVFGKRASFSNGIGPVAFAGTRSYSVHDLPPIDIVLITHDHYDHLEYETVCQLKHKTEHWYTMLGVGSHLHFWGISAQRITELDWWQSAVTEAGFTLTAAPGRHFSGRGLTRNKTLWGSFALKTTQHSVFIGGDSGYDTHFAAIGERLGPFDLAILECGQYNAFWPYIHMMPEETVQATKDLKASVLLPVHWGKFALASHNWDEPVRKVVEAAALQGVTIATPMQGEKFVLNGPLPQTQWWTAIAADTTLQDAAQKG